MRKVNTMRLSAAVLGVAALILIAGGVAIGSNMGFKLNMPLVASGTTPSSGQNMISIPYFNPYSTGCAAGVPNCAGAFCTATGLPAVSTTIQILNAQTGGYTTSTCGTAAANALALTPGQGIRVRGPAVPASIIIVGSHDPTAVITVPSILSSNLLKGLKWFAVPYHTTAVNAQDLCNQMGSPGLPATVQNLDAASGGTTTATCGTGAASTLTLVLGKAYRLRTGNSTTDRTFIPAHY